MREGSGAGEDLGLSEKQSGMGELEGREQWGGGR